MHDPVTGRVVGVVDLTGPLKTAHPLSLALAVTAATTLEHCLAEARRERDARLRQRYGDLPRTATDRLVSADGRLLAGGAAVTEGGVRAIPAGGGEIVLDDGAAAVAEPVGQADAYLVRTLDRRVGKRTAAPTIRFRSLGRDRVELWIGNRDFLLSHRHGEIVVLLAEHPAGMTAEQLAVALYGDHAKPVSARAEISRLRTLLGRWIAADPYRLEAPVESDLVALRRLLREGRIREAAGLHVDVLLPRSEAPGVIELRDELETWTRHAVMTADDPEALWTWISNPAGAGDLPAWVRFLAASTSDPCSPALGADHRQGRCPAKD